MNVVHISALVRKEFVDLARNRTVLAPVVLVTLLALVLPFGVAIAIPAVTGHALAEDADLVHVSRIAAAAPLFDEGRIQLFLFQQFLLLFLLTPITGAMALASHAIVGEKQGRSLEPLLATPIGTFELLIAKVLGALLPTLAISVIGLAMYLGGIALLAAPGVGAAMFSVRTAVLVVLVAPAAALVSLQAAILVSSRVNDPRTAQQFGVLIIIPLAALLVAQFSGALWLSPSLLAIGGVALLVLWLLLALASVALFDRETILTRWR
jgi:ABC-2 type transport system permease protein